MVNLVSIISIIIGYLLGSVSPAYILGRLIKNVDIRAIGTKNAGTTNVFREFGWGPAIITAAYDLLKGLASMAIAYYLFGAPIVVVYIAGLAAIVGHIFPFYLNFSGGEGSATGVAILIFDLVLLLKTSFLPLSSIAVLGGIVVVIYTITRKKGYMGLVALPVAFFLIFKHYAFTPVTVSAGLIIMLLFANNIKEAYFEKLFKFKDETLEQVLVWRTLLRPLAVVFPIAYLFLSREMILWIIGILGGVFLLIDLIRLVSGRVNLYFFSKIKFFLKKREEKRFSSITLFFMGMFTTILLFSRPIANLAITYLIFGDVFAKFFGLQFGEIKIWGKTLEGSIAHLVACLIAGYLWLPYLGLSASVIVIGALVATLAELIPVGINDNFIVTLASAVAMLLAGFVIK